MASLELPDDHVMPVGLPNMYTHVKIRSRQSDENVEGPGNIWPNYVLLVNEMLWYAAETSTAEMSTIEISATEMSTAEITATEMSATEIFTA